MFAHPRPFLSLAGGDGLVVEVFNGDFLKRQSCSPALLQGESLKCFIVHE